MTLEERIKELQSTGANEMAKDLIKGVIGGADSVEMDVTDGEVFVTHPRFEGRHQIHVNDRDKVDVEQRGKYVFTGENDGLDITLRVANSRVASFVEASVTTDDLDDPDESSDKVFADGSSVTVTVEESEPVTVDEEDDEDTSASRTARTLDALRQTMGPTDTT